MNEGKKMHAALATIKTAENLFVGIIVSSIQDATKTLDSGKDVVHNSASIWQPW